MGSNWPILLIEGVLVMGGALLFGWWQLRDVKREQEASARRKAEAAKAAAEPSDPKNPAPP